MTTKTEAITALVEKAREEGFTPKDVVNHIKVSDTEVQYVYNNGQRSIRLTAKWEVKEDKNPLFDLL